MTVKTQNWQDRFDSHFKDLGFHNLPLHQDIRDEVKSFITSLLEEKGKEKDKEWRERIEYTQRYKPGLSYGNPVMRQNMLTGKWIRVSDLLEEKK